MVRKRTMVFTKYLENYLLIAFFELYHFLFADSA